MAENVDNSNVKIAIAIIGAIGLVTVALIGYFATIRSTLLPIEATQTAEAKHTSIAMTTQAIVYNATNTPNSFFTPTITSTYTPSEAPKPAISDAAVSVDNFFRAINNAKTSDDLFKAWNLETKKFQCEESAGCDILKFQNFWMQWKVKYKLYDCGLDIIDTEQIYYLKDSDSVTSPISVDYVRYELKEEEGQLKINSGELIHSPGSYCPLVISVP